MAVARHPMPPEIAALSLEDIAERYIGRFRDKVPDWEAFEDAKIEGYRRAQHRFIGAGGSGKHDDPTVIPPRAFTLSIIYCPPGQGNAAHTHEVEEVFFVLQGILPAWRHPRLSKREPRAGVFPGHAWQRQARDDGLCGRRALSPPRRSPALTG